MAGNLILMCGYPGSGKSHLISDMEKERDRTDPLRNVGEFLKAYIPHHDKSWLFDIKLGSLVVLCPDSFRLVITGKKFHGPAEDIVWSHVKVAARVLLGSGHNIIIDATHLTEGSRSQWIRMAEEFDTKIYCFHLTTDVKTSNDRNSERTHEDKVVPLDAMLRMAESFVVPAVEEGFEEVIKIDDY